MKRQLRAAFLVGAILLVAMLVLSACGGSSGSGGSTSNIKGLVTKVDTSAKTFTVDSNGKTYDFKMVSDSKGDINEVKKHMDTKEQIEVQYKGSSSPYDVVSAD